MVDLFKSKAVGDERCSVCGLDFVKQSMFIDSGLAVLKVVVGLLSGSKALVANGLYSINDLLSALIVLVSLKVGRRPADADHAYGHGKAEFIALAGMSFVLVSGVAFIFYYSLADIFRGKFEAPHISSLGVAALTVIACELQARKAFCCSHQMGNSPAMHTHAEHHRADSLSSIAVFIAIVAAYLGFTVLDQVVALFETVHICWLAGALFGQSFKGLMDSSLPRYEVERIERASAAVPGIARVLDVRTRNSGFKSWIDLTVAVSKNLSVKQAHDVCDAVRHAVRGAVDRTALDINVRFRSSESCAQACALDDSALLRKRTAVEDG
jgi:cation diffusion facilitator family transporter